MQRRDQPLRCVSAPESEIKTMVRIDLLELCVSVRECACVSHMRQHLRGTVSTRFLCELRGLVREFLRQGRGEGRSTSRLASRTPSEQKSRVNKESRRPQSHTLDFVRFFFLGGGDIGSRRAPPHPPRLGRAHSLLLCRLKTSKKNKTTTLKSCSHFTPTATAHILRTGAGV